MKNALKIFVLVFSAMILRGQVTLTATASAASVHLGLTGTQPLTITLTLAGAPAVSALQATIVLPSGWTAGTSVASAALTGAQKQVICGTALCLVYGLNVAAIPVGAVLTIPVTIAASAALGPQQVTLTNAMGASSTGSSVPATVAPLTVTLFSPYDLGGQGFISVADVTSIAAMVAAGNCTVDVVGNGLCNDLQVMAEVLAWIAAGSHA